MQNSTILVDREDEIETFPVNSSQLLFKSKIFQLMVLVTGLRNYLQQTGHLVHSELWDLIENAESCHLVSMAGIKSKFNYAARETERNNIIHAALAQQIVEHVYTETERACSIFKAGFFQPRPQCLYPDLPKKDAFEPLFH